MPRDRALLIDRNTMYAVEVLRTLARQGDVVDAFALPGAPLFRSRFCHRRLRSPPAGMGEAFLRELADVVEREKYDVIHVCTEDVLERVLPLLGTSARWSRLLVPEPAALEVALSKNAILDRAAAAGVPVPRSVLPAGEDEVERLAEGLGWPVVVKGEKGESAQNVRMARDRAELSACYREIRERERPYGGRPALQEFIPGSTYLAGGLFAQGRPLRVWAHRKVLMSPPGGGVTVKAVTVRPPALLEHAFTVAGALGFTGLAGMDFVHDARDGQFRFLEINPRIPASVAVARHAGVDLFTPYRELVGGIAVAPDLRFREGVAWHRLTGELRIILGRPGRLFGFVVDCLDPRVRSDVDWSDPLPHVRWRGWRRAGARPRALATPLPPPAP